jgi:hypothetical protein
MNSCKARVSVIDSSIHPSIHDYCVAVCRGCVVPITVIRSLPVLPMSVIAQLRQPCEEQHKKRFWFGNGQVHVEARLATRVYSPGQDVVIDLLVDSTLCHKPCKRIVVSLKRMELWKKPFAMETSQVAVARINSQRLTDVGMNGTMTTLIMLNVSMLTLLM